MVLFSSLYQNKGIAEEAAIARKKRSAYLKEHNQNNQNAMKPPSDSERVNRRRESKRRRYQSEKREQEGKSPIKRLKTGPKVLPDTGNPTIDRKREMSRLYTCTRSRGTQYLHSPGFHDDQ